MSKKTIFEVTEETAQRLLYCEAVYDVLEYFIEDCGLEFYDPENEDEEAAQLRRWVLERLIKTSEEVGIKLDPKKVDRLSK